jgi:hypothetical protein
VFTELRSAMAAAGTTIGRTTAAAAARPKIVFVVIAPPTSRKASAGDNDVPWRGVVLPNPFGAILRSSGSRTKI